MVSDREILETRWMEKVLAAKHEYDAATVHTRVVMEQQRLWPIPTSDCLTTVIHALENENRTRSKFKEALRIFEELVLNGKVPEE